MNRRILAVAGLVALLVLGGGLAHLFLMRFRAGDIYPPYSSLRTDPLGTRALYESLAALPDLVVERNVQPLEHARFGTNSVLLFLGDTVSLRPNLDQVPASTVGWINRYVRSGGRLVITLQPRDRLWDLGECDSTSNPCGRQACGPAPTNAVERAGDTNRPARLKSGVLPAEEDWVQGIALTNWLGLAFALQSVSGVTTARATVAGREAGLPEQLRCHTALCFTNAAPDWRVLYMSGGRPVFMERRFGQGTIVMSTLSYFVSNEALRDNRESGLLLWLLGGHTRVVFDETHHGLEETAGLMTLVRRYGLRAAVLNLLLLAVLFIWRNSAALVPAADELPADGPEVAVGKDSATGLGNLLRRNLKKSEVVGACVTEWKRTEEAGARLPETALKRMEAMVAAERLLPESQQCPERLYNALCEVVRSEGRGARSEGRGARDEGRGARDEGRGARGEGRGARGEGRRH